MPRPKAKAYLMHQVRTYNPGPLCIDIGAGEEPNFPPVFYVCKKCHQKTWDNSRDKPYTQKLCFFYYHSEQLQKGQKKERSN